MKAKILVYALLALILTTIHLADAQQPKKVARIGYLSPLTPSSDSNRVEVFRQGLRELGYVEGQNIAIEYRLTAGRYDKLSLFAAELVDLKVDLIFAPGATAALAAKNVTKTIPVVMVIGADPVEVGLVESLARPGGNVTGFASIDRELNAKRLELLKEIVPRVTIVAVLGNATQTNFRPQLQALEVVARSMGVQLQPLEVRSPDDFDGAFLAAIKGRAGALIEMPSQMFYTHREQIADLARKSRLPAISSFIHFPEAGGLVSYGTNLLEMDRRAATYVDKILKGTKPADLPVEQPMKFELIINLKTAKQIGLTIPPNVLARADKVLK
jgi:putative ABC transport system substrate-binding protein